MDWNSSEIVNHLFSLGTQMRPIPRDKVINFPFLERVVWPLRPSEPSVFFKVQFCIVGVS